MVQHAERQRVLGSEQALAHLQRAAKAGFGRRVVAAALEAATQHRQRARGIEMVGTQNLLLNGQRTAQRRLGRLGLAPLHRGASQVGQRARGLDMVRPEVPLAKFHRRLHERSQRLDCVRVVVVGELGIEPGCESRRVGTGADGRAPRPARGMQPALTSCGLATSARALQNAPTRSWPCRRGSFSMVS